MRSILNTMPAELPFEHQRVGGFNNLYVIPLANKGQLLPFIMPALDVTTLTDEQLVSLGGDTHQTTNFLDSYQVDGKTVFYNNMAKDVYTIIGSEVPCGEYYYLIEAGGKKYKTGLFRIDNLIDKTGEPGTPQLPVVPQPLGDFNDDFNDDFYNG